MNNRAKIFKQKLKDMIRDNSAGINVYEAVKVLEEIGIEIIECAEKYTTVQDAICAINRDAIHKDVTYL